MWDSSAALVVCRQLGLNTSSKCINFVFYNFYIVIVKFTIDPIAFQDIFYESTYGLRQYILDEVTCSGDESRLSQCFHDGIGFHDCQLDVPENAAVRCGKNNRDVHALASNPRALFSVTHVLQQGRPTTKL